MSKKVDRFKRPVHCIAER